MRRFLFPVLMLAATPLVADETTGTVLAFDRVAHVIVLEDKTVVTIPNPEVIPEGLAAGDTIRIDYKSDGDNGISRINSIAKL